MKASHSIFSILVFFTIFSHASESKKSNTIQLFEEIAPIFFQKMDLVDNITFPKDVSSEYVSAMKDCFTNQKHYLYNLMSPTIEQHLSNEQVDALVNWFKQDEEKILLRVLSGELKQGDVSAEQMAKIIPFTQSDAFQSFIPTSATIANSSGAAGETFAEYCKSIANKQINKDT